MDWTTLHNRFMALAEVEGRSKVSSFCLDISFDGYGEIGVHLGTYDISDWPRHTNLGPFKNEAEAFAATEAKIADAERIVGEESNGPLHSPE